jgi:hypothetical protein
MVRAGICGCRWSLPGESLGKMVPKSWDGAAVAMRGCDRDTPRRSKASVAVGRAMPSAALQIDGLTDR